MISVELLIIAIHYFRLISMPININCKEVTMIILKNVISINGKKIIHEKYLQKFANSKGRLCILKKYNFVPRGSQSSE